MADTADLPAAYSQATLLPVSQEGVTLRSNSFTFRSSAVVDSSQYVWIIRRPPMRRCDWARLNKLRLYRYAEYFTNNFKLGSVALLQTRECSGPEAQP